MKTGNLILTGLMLLVCGACSDDDRNNQLSNPHGFAEYQYTFTYQVEENGTLVEKTATGNKWAELTQAYMLEYEQCPLTYNCDSQRKYELFFYSPGGSHQAEKQATGVSTVQITLVDSLSAGSFPLTGSYAAQNQTQSSKLIAPYFNINLLMENKENGEPDYQYSITGNARVVITNMGNDIYQITTAGTFDGKIYNFHYIGEIKKLPNKPD